MQKNPDKKKLVWPITVWFVSLILAAIFISISLPELLSGLSSLPDRATLSLLSGEEPGFSRRMSGKSKGFIFGDSDTMECVFWDNDIRSDAEQLIQTLKSVLVPGVKVDLLCDEDVFFWETPKAYEIYVDGNLIVSYQDYLPLIHPDYAVPLLVVVLMVGILLLVLAERTAKRIKKIIRQDHSEDTQSKQKRLDA